MTLVHIVGNKSNCFTRHLHPVFLFRQQLNEVGLKFRFFPHPDKPGIQDCDVLIFMADGYRKILPIQVKTHNAALEYLQNYFLKFKRAIWFDDNDSSGMLNARIFPLVHTYAKSQILRDTSYYLEQHLTGAMHRDYVHEKHHIEDHAKSDNKVTKEDLRKLKLSWNLGLVNWNYYFSPSKIVKFFYLINHGKYHLNFIKPEINTRQKQVIFRGRMWKDDPTIGWWRSQTMNRIIAVNKLNNFQTNDSMNIVSRQQFQRELRYSLVTPSPFGKGEICYRDFECFINGSLLFKPNMNHIRTWPDIFVEGETYVEHAWDFSDFNEKLTLIMENIGQYEDIAREGQRRFREVLCDGNGFARQFKSIIAY